MGIMLHRHTLCVVLFCLQAASSAVAAGVRSAALDNMACIISQLGRVPMGPDLMLTAAACGWTGTTESVRVGDRRLLEPPGESTSAYGLCSRGDLSVMVVGRPPLAGVRRTGPLQNQSNLGELELFGLQSVDEPLVTLMGPSLSVDTLQPDSLGVASVNMEEHGLYWLEVSSNSDGDPMVISLVPLVSGGSILTALSGPFRPRAPVVSSSSEVLEDLNRLRSDRGMEPLEADAELEEISRARAVVLAESGQLRHLTPGGTALPEMLGGTELAYAENIARGAGFTEAWSMILASPTHVASCLSPRFRRAGISAALAVDATGWQLVLVQVLADCPEGGPE
jgi:uncharacterized protein YkwD